MSDFVELLDMVTAYQRSAVVAAACETGVAGAIAHRAMRADELAAEHSLHPGAVRALLGALAALGLVEKVGGRYRLSDAGAPLDPGHPRSIAAIVSREWSGYGLWAGVPQTIRDGHARLPSWRSRMRDDPKGALASLAAHDDLAALSEDDLARLAAIGGAGRLLDVGGGAGSHAAALMGATAGLEATVLDLAPVGDLVRARHPEVGFVAGDIALPHLGLVAPAPWDVVLLADVLREGSREAARRLIHEASSLVISGGLLVVYEPLLDEDGDGPTAVAMLTLATMAASEGATTYRASEIHEWMAEAGMAFVETRRGAGSMGVVRGWRP